MRSPLHQSIDETVIRSGVRFIDTSEQQNLPSDDSPENPDSSTPRKASYHRHTRNAPNKSTDRIYLRKGIKHSIPYLTSIKATRDDGHSRFVVKASERWRYSWDVFVFFLFMYVSLVSVFVYSFLNVLPRRGAWFVIERILDVLFSIDVIINFFTSYAVERFDDAPVTLRQTCSKYVSTYFVTDFISTIPWDVIVHHSDHHDENHPILLVRYLRLLRLIKFHRLYRAVRVRESFTRAEIKLHVKCGHWRLLTLSFSVILISHWFACLFYFFGTVPDSTNTAFFTSWTGVEEKVPSSTYGRYILSLYFSIYTITTIGYGDVVPGTTFERTYVNVIMVLGAACFAYVISQVSNIFGELNENFALRRRMMDMLTDLTRIQKLPPSLAIEIKQFFRDYFSHRRVIDEKALLDVMSNGLRQRVLRHMYSSFIQKAVIFNGIPDHKLDSIYCNIQDTFRHKDDVLFNVGDQADCLYIVKNGSVTLIDETGDHVDIGTGPGGVIGLADMPIRRGWKYKAVVTVSSEVLEIPRTFVLEALESQPETLNALRVNEASQVWLQALQVLQRHIRLVALSQRFEEQTREWTRGSQELSEEEDNNGGRSAGGGGTAEDGDGEGGMVRSHVDVNEGSERIEVGRATHRVSRERFLQDTYDDEDADMGINEMRRELRKKRERVGQLEEQIAKMRHAMKELLSHLEPKENVS